MCSFKSYTTCQGTESILEKEPWPMALKLDISPPGIHKHVSGTHKTDSVRVACLPTKDSRGPEPWTWDGALKPRPLIGKVHDTRSLLLRPHYRRGFLKKPPRIYTCSETCSLPSPLTENLLEPLFPTEWHRWHPADQEHVQSVGTHSTAPAFWTKPSVLNGIYCWQTKRGSRFFCDAVNPSRSLWKPMTSSKNEIHRNTKEMKYNETVIKL